jgi:haloalkane dehalogenase
MTGASLEQNMTAARQEHLVPGREIHMQDMRGYRFCEVSLITGTSEDNAIANVWNTTGACDPTPQQFDALDADTIARENGALRAWLDPVRHWMFDRLDVREAGDDRTFGGITGTWMGVVSAATLTQAAVQGSYFPGYIYRNNTFTFTFSKGSEVYLLDAPDGEVFVMQSFTRHRDPTLREDELAHLYNRLDLPDGWGFRAETLDRDLEVSPNIDNLAHVLQDNLHNVYEGSDAGRAFSDLWPENARW